MKSTIYIVVAAFLGAVACSAPRTVEHRGQLIEITDSTLHFGTTPDTLRFGRLHSGEIAVKRITLHNSTDEPVVILRHETTCHCASFEYGHRPILPDTSADIECTFDSRGTEGWQMKLVKIYLSGASYPLTVFIEANVL